jgi:hypothetical protein
MRLGGVGDVVVDNRENGGVGAEELPFGRLAWIRSCDVDK